MCIHDSTMTLPVRCLYLPIYLPVHASATDSTNVVCTIDADYSSPPNFFTSYRLHSYYVERTNQLIHNTILDKLPL